MTTLAGARALIAGVANERSLAWGIARVLRREGAELAFTFQGERLEKRVRKLASELGAAERVYPCDVTDDEAIAQVFQQLRQDWGQLRVIVHSLAYAPRELLQGGYLERLDRRGFLDACEVSAYSFSALLSGGRALLAPGAAALTLSYLGADKAVPHYNVMGVAKAALESSVRYLAADLGPRGIRVNAISAGPVRTLAASGIAGLRGLLAHVAETAPLRRNVALEDIGNAAAFLCSQRAAAITGQVLYVDCGHSILAPLPSGTDDHG